jgi:hypothetical protein
MTLKPTPPGPPTPPVPPVPPEELSPLEYFNFRKESILELLKFYKVNLEVQFPPMTCTSLEENYYIEDMELLKIEHPDLFKSLLDCGFVHNLYLVTALEEWDTYSATHSEESFNSFQYLCLRPPVEIAEINFDNFTDLIESCIDTNKTNITYPFKF